MENKLDKHYHDKKLRMVLRDLACTPADEYARALLRLAKVADDSVVREPEFQAGVSGRSLDTSVRACSARDLRLRLPHR